MTRHTMMTEWDKLGFTLEFDNKSKNTLYYVISDIDKRNGFTRCSKYVGQNLKEVEEVLRKFKQGTWRY